MKISRFAHKNKVSIDTIRHYMDMKLLLPLKNGGQYDFDAQTQEDMTEISQLKSLRFSLKEIQKIIEYKRLSNLPAKAYKAHLIDCYTQQLTKLTQDIKALEKTADDLKQLLTETGQASNTKSKIGIHLDLITYLTCPKCHAKHLNLASNRIENNMIIEGSLTCSCDYTLQIKDGILLGEGYFDSDYSQQFILSDYIKETDTDLIANIRKGINWFDKKLPSQAFDTQVIMELGSGSGFFIRGAIDRIKNAQLYLAIDYDKGRHKHIKGLLESSGIDIPIQFICCDFANIPLKKHCIDILVDSSGSSNYGFDHDEFLLNQVQDFVKVDSHLIASYIIFEKFSSTHPLPLSHRKIFTKQDIINNVKDNNYKITACDQGNSYNKESPQENYFTKDDLVSNIWLYAQKRWG